MIVLTDAETGVQERLRAQIAGVDVTDAVDERRPLLVVSGSGGGLLAGGALDNPRLDIESYAADRAGAWQLIGQALSAVLIEPDGQGWVAGGVVVTSCDLVLRPFLSPDSTQEFRFISTVALTAYPATS